MAMLHTNFVRLCVVNSPGCAKVLRFPGGRGCSIHSRTLIVRLLSVYARLEAIHDMHVVPLRAFFRSRVPGDIEFVSLEAASLVLGCTCNTNVIVACAWMLW